MKKIMALVLVAVMMLAMGTVAFADESYTITIGNPATGETYTAYKLLSATYDDDTAVDNTGALNSGAAIAYYYTGSASDDLYDILDNYFQFDAFVGNIAYVKVLDNNGDPIDYSDVDVAQMAKDINEAGVAALGLTSAGSGNPTITVNEKGYYFVDTTLGSFCAIDSAATVTIYEKNSIPTLTKEVLEDHNETWYTGTAAEGLTAGKATVDVEQLTTFRLTVNTGTEAHNPDTPVANGVDDNYVITDTLPTGVTYEGEFTCADVAGATCTQAGQVLTITLPAAQVATLGQGYDIVMTYKASIDTGATAGQDYTNTAVLTYKAQTSTSTAVFTTYAFEIMKTNSEETALPGVTFTVTKTENDTLYYYAGANATAPWTTTKTLLTTGADGKISVTGVDAAVYTVTEEETLPGYNKADAPFIVTIAENGSVTGDGVVSGVLTVVNYSGTELPSTGGIGTTIFYVIGAILVIGAGVVLVTRRRMNVQ